MQGTPHQTSAASDPRGVEAASHASTGGDTLGSPPNLDAILRIPVVVQASSAPPACRWPT